MEKRQWDELIKHEIEEVKAHLSMLEKELSKYPGIEAFNYLKPLKRMVFTAVSDLYKKKWERAKDDGVNKLINDTIN